MSRIGVNFLSRATKLADRNDIVICLEQKPNSFQDMLRSKNNITYFGYFYNFEGDLAYLIQTCQLCPYYTYI